VSIRLLNAWLDEQPIIHTAVDDLESFMWLLSWALVHILKKYGCKHRRILDVEYALSSKDLRINETKEFYIEHWPDVAFGNLMRDWLKILKSARDDVEKLRSTFSTTPAGSPDRDIACGNLALFCNGVYKNILESGFRHREDISQYSQWEDVIQAMAPLPRGIAGTLI